MNMRLHIVTVLMAVLVDASAITLTNQPRSEAELVAAISSRPEIDWRHEMIATVTGGSTVQVETARYAAMLNFSVALGMLASNGILTSYQVPPGRLTPLHYAALAGARNAAEVLARARPDWLNADAGDGTTPLMAAIATRATGVVSYLLSRGVRLDMPNTEDNTPLAYVAKRADLGLFTLLRSYGAMFAHDYVELPPRMREAIVESLSSQAWRCSSKAITLPSGKTYDRTWLADNPDTVPQLARETASEIPIRSVVIRLEDRAAIDFVHMYVRSALESNRVMAIITVDYDSDNSPQHDIIPKYSPSQIPHAPGKP